MAQASKYRGGGGGGGGGLSLCNRSGQGGGGGVARFPSIQTMQILNFIREEGGGGT